MLYYFIGGEEGLVGLNGGQIGVKTREIWPKNQMGHSLLPEKMATHAIHMLEGVAHVGAWPSFSQCVRARGCSK